MPRNPHNPMPAVRALLVALEDWITRNRAPPASRVPEISQRTAIEASVVKMPKVAGLMQPVGATMIGGPVDWGNPPIKVEKSYGARVPAVNEAKAAISCSTRVSAKPEASNTSTPLRIIHVAAM